jgi:hypothetical protein
MVHLLIGLLLAGGATIAPRPVAGKPTYRVELRPEQRDYQLRSPRRPGPCAIVIEGACPSGKCKLIFETPLPAGRYDLEVRSRLAPDPAPTFVFSVPLTAGTSTFLITAPEAARYDFALHEAASHKEYRFTFSAPVIQKTLEAHF